MEEGNPQEIAVAGPSRDRPADFSVPRKKRAMKSQPRQMQSSIDVLAEVLAERCGDPEGAVCESEEIEEDDGCGGEDEEGGSEDTNPDDSTARSSGLDKDRGGGAKKRGMEPYKFTRCKLKNRHFLREGQGLAMIRSLGLEQFLLHTEVPRFNKSYCTDFITTYSHHKGAGVVNGRLIKITAQAVRKLTGLPLGTRGERAIVHDVRAEDLPVMDRLIPGLKRTSYGYDLRYLRYKDQTETFVAVASALSEKLVCRTFKLTYIKGAIILAMETSLRLKVLMQWADFMAETIKNAIKLTKLRTRNVRFAFGEWLTGMIENALGEELEGEKGTGLVENGCSGSQGEMKFQEKEEPMENDVALLLMAAAPALAPAPESVLAIEAPQQQQETLPLVALTPHKIKKRVRTAMPTTTACGSDSTSEEVKRLQQQLADAERRERWYVTMNLSMARELERLRLELESVKGGQSAALAVKDAAEPREPAEESKEMPLALRSSTPRNGEEAQIDRVIESLEKKSAVHEQEVSRLKQELEEQRKLIELVKRSRGIPLEAIDRREQKRLRRELEKDKAKTNPS
ncbi:hypothetical protein SELMODRAFT_421154 [Selaginella moellendorffii]|uniref:Uncharacterized protein n=1 Tax=Selaginella moellendorffii TaxID=88036 RepID=D8SEP2_SELML|nr:uncharacterized protein LOC9648169 [Selaginella moellendorffii]XP_024542536.1 uncharacterized protein LOC9648169 [Selaginella moellendorffii]EFJ17232.1 hypothetical protein SELMODRAFT_421154 [Selaginella moellendorffii]|eukprot:XP_002981750.1 uncharacterized protein LOC9648169 [Selaginella moellendorffii]